MPGDLDCDHRNPAFSKVLNSDDRMIVPSMNTSAIEMNTIAGYPFCGVRRVIRTISPRRHRRMRGPQVPVPRHTITVMAVYLVPSGKEWMGEADHIAERPNLPFMSVARKHQPHAFHGNDLYVPRRMRDQHSCRSRRPASKRLPYKVACFAVAAPSGEVIDSRQNQTRFHLSPAVVKHVESGILEQAITALQTIGMELMVPGYCPHTEWSGKAAQQRQELKL